MPSLAAETFEFPCPTVPLRYRGSTLDRFRIDGHKALQDALAAATATRSQLLAGERSSLVLLGPPGVGKTHLAAAIVQSVHEALYRPWAEAERAIEVEYQASRGPWEATDPVARVWASRPQRRRHPALTNLPQWVNVATLVVDLKAEMGRPVDDQETAAKARSLRSDPGLLVLDDLGRERISEWTGELVYTIVNDRYEQGLSTIATSNLTTDELVASGYWPAVSRLAQDGRIVEIQAPDWRLRRQVRP